MVAEEKKGKGNKAVLVNRKGDFGQVRGVPSSPNGSYNLRGTGSGSHSSPGVAPAATTPQQAATYEGYNELAGSPQPNFFGSQTTPRSGYAAGPTDMSMEDIPEEEERPRLAGVGIIFRKGPNDEGLVVDGYMPSCPINTRTHVKPGMKLIKVAGRDVTYASQIDIAPLILGPLGTFVDLQLERPHGRRASVEQTWKYRRGSMSLSTVQVERFHEIKFSPSPVARGQASTLGDGEINV